VICNIRELPGEYNSGIWISKEAELSSMSLLDLPVEILSEILTHLDYLDILRSSTVRISFPPHS